MISNLLIMIIMLLLGERWQYNMNLTLIAAISENNVIGIDNKLPWHIPEDLKRFKRLTTGHPVIMGRNTYLSIPDRYRPLPKRKNIVLSTTLEEQNSIYVARNVDHAIVLTEKQESFVIGGVRVFESFLPYVNKMEITNVHQEYEGDIFFPEVNWDDWRLVNEEGNISGNNEIPYSFLSYVRK